MLNKMFKTVKRISGKVFGNRPLVLLDIGHSETSKGAYNFSGDLYEYEFNVALTNRIIELYLNKSLMTKDNKLIKLTDILSLDTINRDKCLVTEVKTINIKNPKFVLSFHCNAFNRKSTGTEVLVKVKDETSKAIGKLLLDGIASVLKLTVRGLKEVTPEDRGGYFLYNIKAPVVILEPFFIDNDSDLNIATDKFNSLAYMYLSNIVSIITKTPEAVLV